MPKVRIVLADDHTVMRSGLKLLLEREAGFTVVGEAPDGREAVQTVDEQSPDVVVMDMAMPNLNGIEAAVRIVDSHPRTAVIILSMHSDERYVLRALKAGARGYLLKDSAESDLIAAVKVNEGRTFFPPAISNCWWRTTFAKYGTEAWRIATSYLRRGNGNCCSCWRRGKQPKR